MSRKDLTTAPVHPGLREVRVEVVKPRRHTHGPTSLLETRGGGIAKISSRSTDYVYVNAAYVGSVNSVAGSSNRLPEPPTSVIREQYWACSRWPFAQKMLALTVGVLLGAVIGLSITFALDGVSADDVIGGIFRTSSTPATE